ncbi:hypothetical protein Tco_0726434 [Tanacetum coccineum]|uniref:Uncharacterized protein n=1 Tax=Tanacetum coccineum TaxID=301880 RepID=A0ABQ4YH75_9ASTR
MFLSSNSFGKLLLPEHFIEIELTATIDGKVKIVRKASVRRHLQLTDYDGISSLPTTKIFKQLSLMGAQLFRVKDQHTQHEYVVPQPRSPTQSLIVDEVASTSMDVRYRGATTTVTGLEARQGSEYGAAYTRLIKKVKKLEKTVKSSQARRRAKIVVSDDEDDLEDPSKQGRKINEIDQDPGILLEVSTAEKDVSTAKPVSTAGAVVTTASVAAVSTASPTRRVSTADDITMAKTLVYIRKSAAKDKVAVRLQAELEEKERQRITRIHEATSSLNVEEYEDIQARVEADEELAQRLQAEEREIYTEAEQARMLHMGSHTLQQLRGYSFDEIKTLFETTIRRVNTFVPMESEVDRAVPKLAAGSSKRDAEELDQESSKRQKTSESSELAEEPRVKEANELSQEEIQQMMIIVPELGTNVEALQTKYPIIDWEIYTEGTRKDDLVMLWSLVKKKFNSTEPTNDTEKEIWVELKRLFKPDTNDELWKLQKHIHDLTWRLYDSCGVHHVSTEKGIDIYMLVEKKYPLSRGTLTLMLVAKLLVDQDNEMSRELLRKIFM